MLRYLYIKNFILFKEVSLNFSNGFSAFTGETGAGKSLLVDALDLLCAGRANQSMIYKDCEQALIEGTFDFSKHSKILNVFKEMDFEIDDCEEVIITRIIKSDGKSTCKINQRIVPLHFLKSIMEKVIDIHSQNDTQYLLKESHQIQLLDSFAQSDTLKASVESAYQQWQLLVKTYEEKKSISMNEDDLAYIRFQIQEIEEASLDVNEEEALLEEEKEYEQVTKHLDALKYIMNLYEQSYASSAYEIHKQLSTIHIEPLQEIIDKLQDFYYENESAFETIASYLSKLSLSEERIQYVQNRLGKITQLKRKYGNSIEAILKHKEDLIETIHMHENKQDVLLELASEIENKEKVYLDCAHVLSKHRKKQALLLDTTIKQHLEDLLLPHAQFKTHIEPGLPSKNGIDKISFLISMNISQPLKPLKEVASGGELSRLMLGLKVIFASLEGLQTIVFDEIDTGVSGVVATAIGQKMKMLGEKLQVLSITHLSQVAACAQNHYFVSKVNDTITSSSIRLLNTNERIDELALMSSGNLSTASRKAAKELLEKNI